MSEICYPVFKLGENEPQFDNGVCFYYYTRTTQEDQDIVDIRIVDDKTLEGDKLATRRLALLSQGVPLYKISYALYFLGDLIKIATPNTWFIDSSGKVFQYKKTTRAKLKPHKIVQILPIQTGGAVLEVEGIASRFKTLFVPPILHNYAGILYFGKSLILYGTYENQFKETWRMV